MIRTTEETKYNTRDDHQGIVAIDVVSWARNKRKKTYTAFIEDYVQVPNENGKIGEAQYIYRKIASKTKQFSNEEIQALFEQIGEGIPANSNYNDENDSLIDKALLAITLNYDPPTYNTTNWEIFQPENELIK